MNISIIGWDFVLPDGTSRFIENRDFHYATQEFVYSFPENERQAIWQQLEKNEIKLSARTKATPEFSDLSTEKPKKKNPFACPRCGYGGQPYEVDGPEYVCRRCGFQREKLAESKDIIENAISLALALEES